MKLVSRALCVAITAGLSIVAYADNTQLTSNDDAQQADLTQQVGQLQQQIQVLQSQIASKLNYAQSYPKLSKLDHAASSHHVHLDQSADAAFEQFPSTSFGLSVLKERNQFDDNDLVFGGYLEQDTQYWSGDKVATIKNGTYQTGSQASLTSAKIDTMANINSWSTIFLSVSDTTPGNGDDVTVPKAFVLFGNLDKTPLYLTVGKNYLPFGLFGGGGPWTAPLTRSYFRPSETAQLAAGYYKDNLNTSLAVFADNSTNIQKNNVNDFVYSIAYSNNLTSPLTYTVGAGYLNDLRGTSSGIGNDAAISTSRNPAFDLNAAVGYTNLSMGVEYLQATQEVLDNTGKPTALDISASYSPMILGKSTTFMISRDTTTNLNGVPVGLAGDAAPGAAVASGLKNQWTLSATRQFLNNVYIGYEFENAKTYLDQNTYTNTIDISAYF